jgi:hypothetical protein
MTPDDALIEMIRQAIVDAIWSGPNYVGADVAARAVLNAINNSGTHRVVPVEPTDAMKAAVYKSSAWPTQYALAVAAAPRVSDDG